MIGVLELATPGSEKVRLCARMTEGEEFILSFTHSVNKRPVFDTLRVEGDHLVIVKSLYDSFGAGMPEATTGEGTFAVRDDGWLEWTVNRPVPEVTVRVGRVADHRIHLKGRDIRLADLTEPGQALTFRVREIPLFQAMKGRCLP